MSRLPPRTTPEPIAKIRFPSDVRRINTELGRSILSFDYGEPRPTASLTDRADASLSRPSDKFETGRRLELAISGLAHRFPHLSAANVAWRRAQLLLVMLLVVVPLLSFVVTGSALAGPIVGLTLLFAAATLIRIAALVNVTCSKSARQSDNKPKLAELPKYLVLVPLYQEAEIARGTISAMRALDYPEDKLDVAFVCESGDTGTVRALVDAGLQANMRIVQVPDAQPRTKPKALNFAMVGTDADFVVVYDAEDVPEPNQLRDAVAAFACADAALACLQARLNTYNPSESWLTRQFTLEYSALFDGLLPALERLRLPIPLGGTSNHFRRVALEKAGAWDAHNVTEDADLGFRLLRFGYRVGVLDSTTLEEAPATWQVWRNQRTRWIKGWLQTYAVHGARPATLLRELGAWRFAGFHVLVGGVLLSSFLHPLLYVLVGVELLREHPFVPPSDGWERAIWLLAAINLAAGLVTACLLAAVSAARRGYWSAVVSAASMPAYWLVVTVAAYRAVFQLATAPTLWEKTLHRARRPEEGRSIFRASAAQPD